MLKKRFLRASASEKGTSKKSDRTYNEPNFVGDYPDWLLTTAFT